MGGLCNLISVFEQMGELSTFTRGKRPRTQRSVICNSSYPLFIIQAVNYARKLGKIDVLVLDNRKATIPGLLIRSLNLAKYIIQDCRELYLFDEVNHFTGKQAVFLTNIGKLYMSAQMNLIQFTKCVALNMSKVSFTRYFLM